MRLDGFDAQLQARRDLLGRLPLRDALDDLALAGGQRVPWQRCPAHIGLHHRGRDPRTHIDRALDHGVDGLHEIRRRLRLHDIADRPGRRAAKT